MANNTKCTICGTLTPHWFPGMTFGSVPPEPSSEIVFPQDYICGSRNCLHRFIDRCFEEHEKHQKHLA